jgi:uncharacterized protein (TIGR03067 family)
MRYFAAVFFALTSVILAISDDLQMDGDLKILQGDWQFVSAIEDGKPVLENNLTKWRLKFSGKVMIYSREEMGGDESRLEFSIGENKTPKTIDLVNTKTQWPWIGIYSVDKKELKICIVAPSSPRPTSFELPKNFDPSSLLVIWQLRRR